MWRAQRRGPTCERPHLEHNGLPPPARLWTHNSSRFCSFIHTETIEPAFVPPFATSLFIKKSRPEVVVLSFNFFSLSLSLLLLKIIHSYCIYFSSTAIPCWVSTGRAPLRKLLNAVQTFLYFARKNSFLFCAPLTGILRYYIVREMLIPSC